MRLIALASSLLIASIASSAMSGAPQRAEPFAGVLDEHPAIQYATRPVHDPVASLARAVGSGERTLPHREDSGYLRAVLGALDIPEQSQLLVFSRTGLQRAHTGPRTPRALYFNDAVVVGFIPGARYLEVAAQDPEQGVSFYTIDQTVAATPAIERRTNCLTCHVSGSTLEVPGMITRSNFVDDGGSVIPQLGFQIVNHRTPLLQRWGGWFVSGYPALAYAGVGHMGNTATTLHRQRNDISSMSTEVFIHWRSGTPGAHGYPSRDSDIVPLMLFDHQMHAMNLLTRLNWETRVAVASGSADFTQGPLRRLASDLVDYFLFVDEVPPPAQLTPHPRFAEWFTRSGPMDPQGRSLRQLDLERRLLRYACSYLIYSEAFDHLPAAAREAVYARMWAVLSGADVARKYSHLDQGQRRAIIEILRATKRDLPESFR